MGNAVVRHGLYDGVTTDNLAVGLSSGVTIVSGLDISSEDTAQFRQSCNELTHNRLRFFNQFTLLSVPCSLSLILLGTQSCYYLLCEQMAETVQADADVIG